MYMVELTRLRERLDELLSKGYIRPSSSPFAAPVLMVPKPGKPEVLRMVCDYRSINNLTVKDKYPLPDIQQLFDSMHGAKYFSSFDAVDGFWQMAMAPEDIEKTAFTSPHGSYEWLVMPMGLTNSPSCYQRRMQRALGHLPFARIFLDDCILFSTTLEEHYEHLKQFLEVCEVQGIYLKEPKPTPADGVALGGVLMQDVGKGLQPIAFESRQFNGAEQNYHAGERELCALHHCTTHTWRHYLIWTEFQLQGDHKPLVWLMSPGQPLSRRQARWYMDLVETLQVAERTYEEATLAVQTRSGKKKSGKVAEPPASPAIEDASKNQRGDASTRLLEPSDRQDWKFRADMFDFLKQEYGPFEVDACRDLGGKN
ncbi:hypothetical protein CYMTET_6478 [Cymbomonas tetramitiformis]|uniref:Reverse transcriptase domain-containing protein n=1 Tax=Cymbomonas tetramitiformis TaxID=36881 RepID=A0AAE0GYX0_9CHLO|nr:hypothetical protein CYMTET_6478 [Cymbomonas tetramitiformis]